MSLHVHWHEGLFLLPHHLQRLQRSVHEESERTRQLIWPYPYGVVSAELSVDDLANFRVRFDHLRVILPSGLEVHCPENADLPSLDLKPLFATSAPGFTLLLGVPLWQAKRANTVEGQGDARAKLIFRTAETTLLDENTGDNPKPVLVRRLNARLLTDQDDRGDLEVVPLLRVVRGAGEQLGVPRWDAEYVPPSLFLGASPALFSLVRDLVNQVEASRRELVVQINRGGFSLESLRGVQIEQLLRLQVLNRATARLTSLLAAPGISPFAWFLEFRQLQAELSGLHPEKDDFAAVDYTHDNLFPLFSDLAQRVRSLLRGAIAASYLKLDFTPEAGFHAAALTDEHFTRPVDYFLAVRSKQDSRLVVRLVEDGNQFKLMPRSLATRAIRGIELKEERVPPLQLPAATGLTFFRLMRVESQRVWSQIQVEKSAIVRWPDMEQTDFQVALYMTLPT